MFYKCTPREENCFGLEDRNSTKSPSSCFIVNHDLIPHTTHFKEFLSFIIFLTLSGRRLSVWHRINMLFNFDLFSTMAQYLLIQETLVYTMASFFDVNTVPKENITNIAPLNFKTSSNSRVSFGSRISLRVLAAHL